MQHLLLLNKADLVPAGLRSKWADYFESEGVQHVFFSAKCSVDDAPPPPAGTPAPEDTDARTRLYSTEQLVHAMEALATRAHAASSSQQAGNPTSRSGSGGAAAPHAAARPPTVGLVGYPNVGKSSTINSIFGRKATAVAPTPGKTKHFQTLHLTPRLMLCDCPGLVPPRLARSKADMVAAGAPRRLKACWCPGSGCLGT
jgi:large subunit GTPase 1